MTMLPRLFFVAIFLLATAAAEAHSSHTSVTEVEWNQESKRFEVAMKLQIADLQDAISARQGKRIRIDSGEATEAVLQYVTEHFSVTFVDDQKCRLHWVGQELELHDAWLYFEVEPTGDVRGSVAVDRLVATPSEKPKKVSTWNELFVVPATRTGEFTATSRIADCSISVRDTVLCDIQPDQTNLVTIRVAGATRSLVFEHEHDSATAKSANVRHPQK
jgi:hypothetical protein